MRQETNAAKSPILNDDPNSLEQARISTRDGNTNVIHILIQNANEVHWVDRGAGFYHRAVRIRHGSMA